jgi:hypothetical protein
MGEPGKHRDALDELRAELVNTLLEARDSIRWSSGYVNHEYRRVGFEHARRILRQLRALDAVRAAANAADGFPATETTRDRNGVIHQRAYMVRPW